MNMRSGYEFLRDCCGTYIIKQSMLDLKDTVPVVGGKSDTSTTNLQSSSTNAPVNGHLFRNLYIPFCLCGCILPCIKQTFEVTGYGQKLSESRPPPSCFTCPPEYQILDGQEKGLGNIKYNCIGLFCPCLAELYATTFNNPMQYTIRKPCCYLPCCFSYEIKDINGNIAGEIKFDGGLLMWKASYTINYLTNIPNADKILLLSTIPFLP